MSDVVLQRAYDAVGAFENEPRDKNIDLTAHIEALESSPHKGDIASLLEFLRAAAASEAVAARIKRYRLHDEAAIGARDTYRFFSRLFQSLVVVHGALLLYLVLVPDRLDMLSLRFLLLLAATDTATVALAAAKLLKDGTFLSRLLPGRGLTRYTLPGGFVLLMLATTYLLYRWPAAQLLAHDRAFVLTACTLAVFVSMIALDFLAQGPIGTLLPFKSPKTRWLVERSRAEAIRREHFDCLITRAKVATQLFPTAPSGSVPFALQVCEYMRRFHVEAQQKHYTGLAAAVQGRVQVRWSLQRLAIAVALAAAIVQSGFSHFAAASEQAGDGDGSWLWQIFTGYLVYGYEQDWTNHLLALIIAAVACTLLMGIATSSEDLSRNRQRYHATADKLVTASSGAPGSPKAQERTPLKRARLACCDSMGAAPLHALNRIQDVCRGVNAALAEEKQYWNLDMSFTLQSRPNDPRALRVTSASALTPDDFRRICEEAASFGVYPMIARKTGFVSVREATRDEQVITFFDSVETRGNAKPGNWIVANMTRDFRFYRPETHEDPDNYLLRDSQGNLDTYIISKDDKKANYRQTQHSTSVGRVYEWVGGQSDIEAIELRGGFRIIAPWGELQERDVGYLIHSGGEVYGIYGPIFSATYERTG